LQTFARRLQDFDGGSLFVARLGGDEFAIVGPFGAADEAHRRLADLREVLIQPFMVAGAELSVGASIGACVFPGDAADRTMLINHTDLALYRAKTEPAEKICFFDHVMDEAIHRRRELVADLRRAIDHDELDIDYQIQTRISDRSVIGHEALLRWHHPVCGKIPPSAFIPLAEENGLILPLGEWVLRRACVQCAPLGIKVAVNLSPLQFLHANLCGLVAEILADTGMKAENLELELTESAIIHEKQRTLLQLQQIRALGVTIALDDFGAGYSSLGTLRAFPFDRIKLDRSFVQEIVSSPQALSIVRAVLTLGRCLEIPVLAEGIETEDQLSTLAAEGCDAVQGYLLGRPMPMETMLSQWDQRSDAA
jgi:predicted signal transduction protein with EAL and GGDEF domain